MAMATRASRRKFAGQWRTSALLITSIPSGSRRYQTTACRGAPSGASVASVAKRPGAAMKARVGPVSASGSGMPGWYASGAGGGGTRRDRPSAYPRPRRYAMQLDGMHVGILAADGVEDLEFWVTVMRLREEGARVTLSLIHISEPTRLVMSSYA